MSMARGMDCITNFHAHAIQGPGSCTHMPGAPSFLFLIGSSMRAAEMPPLGGIHESSEGNSNCLGRIVKPRVKKAR